MTEESDQPTVLIVDDEEDVADIQAEMLAEFYDVRTAYSSLEAIAKLDPAVDVLLLDRRLPGTSGDEVIEHIREWDVDVRIAIVSGVDPDEEIIDMPFDDYITKPVKRDELHETVEQLLLFDQYEELLAKYNSVCKKHAILSAKRADASDEALEQLETRRDQLATELDEVVDAFDEGGVASVLRRAHGRSS